MYAIKIHRDFEDEQMLPTIYKSYEDAVEGMVQNAAEEAAKFGNRWVEHPDPGQDWCYVNAHGTDYHGAYETTVVEYQVVELR